MGDTQRGKQSERREEEPERENEEKVERFDSSSERHWEETLGRREVQRGFTV